LEAPVCPAISEFALFRAVAPVPVARPTANAPDVLSTAGWRIVEASAPGAETLLDDDASTIWITPAPTPGHPVQATIDLGASRQVAGFSLTPSRAVMTGAAPPKGYRAETSEDGQHWQPAGAGELSNIAYALSTQRLNFPEVRQIRYLRLSFAETAVPAERLAIAGIGAFSRLR
ncbi:discoidin domain-containing protein, partial [Xanthomonas citri]